MDSFFQIVQELISSNQLTAALDQILTSVSETIELTGQIESGVTQQSASADQISKASQQLSQLTNEISAAAHKQSAGTMLFMCRRADFIRSFTPCINSLKR